MDGIERFMICNGILSGTPQPVSPSRVLQYSDLINIRTAQAGIYLSQTAHNSRVSAGQALARVIDPCTGRELETLVSPVDGIVFFQHNEPLRATDLRPHRCLENSGGLIFSGAGQWPIC